MHHFHRRLKQGLGLISAASLLASCGSKSTSGVGTVTLALNVSNYSQTTTQNKLLSVSPFTTGLAATNTNNLGANSILSAAPEAMIVNLMSVDGLQSSGSVNFWKSTDAAGTPITLQNGSTDLSTLNLSSLSVAAGTYTGLQLTFARAGQIKGCLQGTFGGASSAGSHSGTLTYSAPFSTTPLSLTTDPLNASGAGSTVYTFCTRSDKSYYNAETYSTTAIGANSDYEPTSSYFTGKTDAEFVKIDLGSGNDGAKTMAELQASTVSISSGNAFTVTVGASTALSMAVDLNRMMEFFANTRDDFNPPNPTMKSGTSYFFTTKFLPVGTATATSTVSVFAGKIGSVQGYQYSLTGSGSAINGWFTVYLDDSGNYLGGSFYEDDDNGLTILKGNATVSSGTLATGAAMAVDISKTTVTGFTSKDLNGTGTATATWQGTDYTLSYTRLL